MKAPPEYVTLVKAELERETIDTMEQNERRFAVLIDADNVSPKYTKYILGEVSDQGIATYKRIYGDWTDTEKRSWKNVLLDWSVNPIQQYSFTTWKSLPVRLSKKVESLE